MTHEICVKSTFRRCCSLHEARNRLRGFYGAARAAEMAGDRRKAAEHYGKLVALTQKADSDRQEVQQAKAFRAAR